MLLNELTDKGELRLCRLRKYDQNKQYDQCSVSFLQANFELAYAPE